MINSIFSIDKKNSACYFMMALKFEDEFNFFSSLHWHFLYQEIFKFKYFLLEKGKCLVFLVHIAKHRKDSVIHESSEQVKTQNLVYIHLNGKPASY